MRFYPGRTHRRTPLGGARELARGPGVANPSGGYAVSMPTATAPGELGRLTSLAEDALATWRLVRLVRSDYLTQSLRDRVYGLLDGDEPVDVRTDDPDRETEVGTCVCGHPREQHAGDGCHATGCECHEYRPMASARVARLRHPKLATLLECPYCLGVWAAACVLVLRGVRADWLVRLLAVSALASELAVRESRSSDQQLVEERPGGG